ncbi:hypothetical protein HDU92_003744 [Lobulomyces angularis]|nr:hypothetical protein HDU92_003744 [Lobulomyces angularis]
MKLVPLIASLSFTSQLLSSPTSLQDVLKNIKKNLDVAKTDKSAPFPGRGFSDNAGDDIDGELDLTWQEGVKLLQDVIDTPFELNPDKLPKKGSCENLPWPSDFFPVMRDGINSHFNDKNNISATVKYARAFDMNEKELEDIVSAAAGIDRQVTLGRTCKEDSDCTEYKDLSVCAKRFDSETGRNETLGECIPFWFGLCHAWTPSSIMEPEPQCPVTLNGTEFGIMDIKALLIQSYDATNFSTVFTGRRCMDTSGIKGAPALDEFGRFNDSDCKDMSPHFFHLAMSNMVGIHGKSFIIDITADIQVWNQPIAGYEILSEKSLTKQEALDAVFPGIPMEETGFNENATSFTQFEMKFEYITEATSSKPLVSTGLVNQFMVPLTVNYVLSTDKDGDIVGSEWIGSSKVNHPDFLWLPTSAPAEDSKSAGIQYSNVKLLSQMSQECLELFDETETLLRPSTTPNKSLRNVNLSSVAIDSPLEYKIPDLNSIKNNGFEFPLYCQENFENQENFSFDIETKDNHFNKEESFSSDLQLDTPPIRKSPRLLNNSQKFENDNKKVLKLKNSRDSMRSPSVSKEVTHISQFAKSPRKQVKPGRDSIAPFFEMKSPIVSDPLSPAPVSKSPKKISQKNNSPKASVSNTLPNKKSSRSEKLLGRDSIAPFFDPKSPTRSSLRYISSNMTNLANNDDEDDEDMSLTQSTNENVSLLEPSIDFGSVFGDFDQIVDGTSKKLSDLVVKDNVEESEEDDAMDLTDVFIRTRLSTSKSKKRISLFSESKESESDMDLTDSNINVNVPGEYNLTKLEDDGSSSNEDDDKQSTDTFDGKKFKNILKDCVLVNQNISKEVEEEAEEAEEFTQRSNSQGNSFSNSQQTTTNSNNSQHTYSQVSSVDLLGETSISTEYLNGEINIELNMEANKEIIKKNIEINSNTATYNDQNSECGPSPKRIKINNNLQTIINATVDEELVIAGIGSPQKGVPLKKSNSFSEIDITFDDQNPANKNSHSAGTRMEDLKWNIENENVTPKKKIIPKEKLLLIAPPIINLKPPTPGRLLQNSVTKRRTTINPGPRLTNFLSQQQELKTNRRNTLGSNEKKIKLEMDPTTASLSEGSNNEVDYEKTTPRKQMVNIPKSEITPEVNGNNEETLFTPKSVKDSNSKFNFTPTKKLSSKFFSPSKIPSPVKKISSNSRDIKLTPKNSHLRKEVEFSPLQKSTAKKEKTKDVVTAKGKNDQKKKSEKSNISKILAEGDSVDKYLDQCTKIVNNSGRLNDAAEVFDINQADSPFKKSTLTKRDIDPYNSSNQINDNESLNDVISPFENSKIAKLNPINGESSLINPKKFGYYNSALSSNIENDELNFSPFKKSTLIKRDDSFVISSQCKINSSEGTPRKQPNSLQCKVGQTIGQDSEINDDLMDEKPINLHFDDDEMVYTSIIDEAKELHDIEEFNKYTGIIFEIDNFPVPEIKTVDKLNKANYSKEDKLKALMILAPEAELYELLFEELELKIQFCRKTFTEIESSVNECTPLIFSEVLDSNGSDIIQSLKYTKDFNLLFSEKLSLQWCIGSLKELIDRFNSNLEFIFKVSIKYSEWLNSNGIKNEKDAVLVESRLNELSKLKETVEISISEYSNCNKAAKETYESEVAEKNSTISELDIIISDYKLTIFSAKNAKLEEDLRLVEIQNLQLESDILELREKRQNIVLEIENSEKICESNILLDSKQIAEYQENYEFLVNFGGWCVSKYEKDKVTFTYENILHVSFLRKNSNFNISIDVIEKLQSKIGKFSFQSTDSRAIIMDIGVELVKNIFKEYSKRIGMCENGNDIRRVLKQTQNLWYQMKLIHSEVEKLSEDILIEYIGPEKPLKNATNSSWQKEKPVFGVEVQFNNYSLKSRFKLKIWLIIIKYNDEIILSLTNSAASPQSELKVLFPYQDLKFSFENCFGKFTFENVSKLFKSVKKEYGVIENICKGLSSLK